MNTQEIAKIRCGIHKCPMDWDSISGGYDLVTEYTYTCPLCKVANDKYLKAPFNNQKFLRPKA